jgi:hypothetical protein
LNDDIKKKSIRKINKSGKNQMKKQKSKIKSPRA